MNSLAAAAAAVVVRQAHGFCLTAREDQGSPAVTATVTVTPPTVTAAFCGLLTDGRPDGRLHSRRCHCAEYVRTYMHPATAGSQSRPGYDILVRIIVNVFDTSSIHGLCGQITKSPAASAAGQQRRPTGVRTQASTSQARGRERHTHVHTHTHTTVELATRLVWTVHLGGLQQRLGPLADRGKSVWLSRSWWGDDEKSGGGGRARACERPGGTPPPPFLQRRVLQLRFHQPIARAPPRPIASRRARAPAAASFLPASPLVVGLRRLTCLSCVCILCCLSSVLFNCLSLISFVARYNYRLLSYSISNLYSFTLVSAASTTFPPSALRPPRSAPSVLTPLLLFMDALLSPPGPLSAPAPSSFYYYNPDPAAPNGQHGYFSTHPSSSDQHMSARAAKPAPTTTASQQQQQRQQQVPAAQPFNALPAHPQHCLLPLNTSFPGETDYFAFPATPPLSTSASTVSTPPSTTGRLLSTPVSATGGFFLEPLDGVKDGCHRDVHSEILSSFGCASPPLTPGECCSDPRRWVLPC